MSYGPDQIPYKELNLPPSPVNTVHVAAVVQPLDLEAVMTVQILLEDSTGRYEPISQRLAVSKNDSGVDNANTSLRVALRYIDPTRPTLLCHTLAYPPTLDLSRYPNLTLKHLNRDESPAYQRLLRR